MSDFMPKKDYDLTEITRLLLEMRDNCVPKAGDAHDDPKRAEKYDALNAAIDLINNPSMLAKWISVKDRLPDVCFETNTYKETDDVFAIDDVGDKCVGRFAISKYDGSYTFYGYTADAEERDPLIVTHWLDCMPEPPKEE